jgi:predicted DsbA family dithiol-disulfide isomerase
VKVEIYSDVVCPWCYIGERRLARAIAALPAAAQVEVVFRPYQLDPQAPEEAVPLPEHLARRFGSRVGGMLERVSAAGRGEGLSFAWDKALSVNTRTAHRLLLWAEQTYGPGPQRALAERLFALYFTQGGNIADVDQLAGAAAEAGMDGDRARAHLRSDEGVQALEGELAKARDLGISAVPTFVIDGEHVVEGAQPVATFVDILEHAARTAAAATADGESCADDTCAT